MQTLSITVITPVYNREKEISRMLDSILNLEEYFPSHVYIMDDASTDKTVEVCESYIEIFKRNNIVLKIFKSETNHGPSYQRNKGWDNTRTEFIALLDSDDIWLKYKLIKFNYDNNLFNIDFWSSSFTPTHLKIDKNKTFTLPFFKQLIQNHVTCSTAIIRRSIDCRFDVSMKHCEDFNLFNELAYKYKLYYNPSVLTRLGRVPNSTGGLSSNLIKMRLGELKSYINITKYNKYFIIILPFAIIFSIIKHIRIIYKK